MFENAPTCYGASRRPDLEFPQKMQRKMGRNSGTTPKYLKMPERGTFGVFFRISEFGGVFWESRIFGPVFFLKLRVGSSRGSAAGRSRESIRAANRRSRLWGLKLHCVMPS